MYKRTDNKGQASAELILIIGGLLVIVLLVGNYISNITQTTEQKFKAVLKEERDFLINNM